MLRNQIYTRLHALAYRISQKRPVEGVTTAGLLSDAADWDTAEPKLASALRLIREHAPVRFTRLKRDVAGIWIIGEVGPLAAWEYRLRLIRLRASYVVDANTTPAWLACTIVHEATHAHLWRFGYDEGLRARIERICRRSERVFLQRVPGERELLEWHRSLPVPADADYTDEAFRRRVHDQLRKLGTPRWVMRLLGAPVPRDDGEQAR